MRVSRYRVSGRSMEPALQEGDRVLVVRGRWYRPRAGDIVVFLDPRDRAGVLVKRVSRSDSGGVVVFGDNLLASTDSLEFGPISERLILGRVFYRYHPSPSVGLIKRSGGGLS